MRAHVRKACFPFQNARRSRTLCARRLDDMSAAAVSGRSGVSLPPRGSAAAVAWLAAFSFCRSGARAAPAPFARGILLPARVLPSPCRLGRGAFRSPSQGRLAPFVFHCPWRTSSFFFSVCVYTWWVRFVRGILPNGRMMDAMISSSRGCCLKQCEEASGVHHHRMRVARCCSANNFFFWSA